MPVKITSKRDGFWRCKTQFFKEPKVFSDNHFNKKDMARLEAEPMLTVEKMKPEDEAGAEGKKVSAKTKGGKKK